MTSVQPVLVRPNQFRLGGYDTEIAYDTTSIIGVPQLTYKTRSQTLNFRGDQIQTEQTQLGQMVTVHLSNNPQAIGVVETLTLLIPTINLSLETKEGSIQTIAILNLRSPQVKILGQSQNYMTLCLSGIASQVDF
jgi:hypothetical protein